MVVPSFTPFTASSGIGGIFPEFNHTRLPMLLLAAEAVNTHLLFSISKRHHVLPRPLPRASYLYLFHVQGIPSQQLVRIFQHGPSPPSYRNVPTRCPHKENMGVCKNRANHPRHDVVHFRNAELSSFNGCGFCKVRPPPRAASPDPNLTTRPSGRNAIQRQLLQKLLGKIQAGQAAVARLGPASMNTLTTQTGTRSARSMVCPFQPLPPLEALPHHLTFLPTSRHQIPRGATP